MIEGEVEWRMTTKQKNMSHEFWGKSLLKEMIFNYFEHNKFY